MSMISQEYYKHQPVLRRQFRSELNAVFQSHQIHIGVMDEDIERMELKREERRRKGRTRRRLSSTLPSTHDFMQGSDDNDSWSQGEDDEE